MRSDESNLEDEHSLEYTFVRDVPYTYDGVTDENNWYKSNYTGSGVTNIQRVVRDYITWDVTSYVTVRLFRKTQ